MTSWPGPGRCTHTCMWGGGLSARGWLWCPSSGLRCVILGVPCRTHKHTACYLGSVCGGPAYCIFQSVFLYVLPAVLPASPTLTL